jgi:hypothetical protein
MPTLHLVPYQNPVVISAQKYVSYLKSPKTYCSLHIPLSKTHYYIEPDKLFEAAWKRFPDGQLDMWNASRCFAIGQHSACVFHCMNVLQRGLYSLADHLGVTFKFPIELANWNQVIVEIEYKIGNELQMLGKQDRSAERERRLTVLGT